LVKYINTYFDFYKKGNKGSCATVFPLHLHYIVNSFIYILSGRKIFIDVRAISVSTSNLKNIVLPILYKVFTSAVDAFVPLLIYDDQLDWQS
jgi:hypothetical protein